MNIKERIRRRISRLDKMLGECSEMRNSDIGRQLILSFRGQKSSLEALLFEVKTAEREGGVDRE